ncbi:MAG: PhoH family protein [Bacteroidetes bacterium]|nr:PhoH family protein [Bacteroidota bacterium]
MVEKIITLDDVSLVDFLGVENHNIKQIAASFPQSKIVSRGNEIKIKGSPPEIIRINDILNALIAHYQKYGKITPENIKTYLNKTSQDLSSAPEEEIIVYGNKGVAIKPRTENQAKLVKSVQKNDLVFVTGPAGTGKTYISVALAVGALKNKELKRIIITRPAVEAGENLGFLPGDIKEKVDPFLRPVYDALNDMVPPEKLKYYQENHIIEIAPLAYMRGRTLSNAFILLDEAQNTTTMQIKMFMTRMGADSKMIITGDPTQIDLPKDQKSGLIEAMVILKNIKDISFVKLDSSDVVRHRLVKDIVDAYGKWTPKK